MQQTFIGGKKREDFSEFELHFLKRTLPKFNLYNGEYL